MKLILCIAAFYVWAHIVPGVVFASAYILPYPPAMPGNKIYSIGRLADRLLLYWNFGTLAAARYRMHLSDKYLVEAKTLFEYSQYLLAMDAVDRSDRETEAIRILLPKLIAEGKLSDTLKSVLLDESREHIRVLTGIMEDTPERFSWTPEKSDATELLIHDTLRKSVELRKSTVQGFEYLN